MVEAFYNSVRQDGIFGPIFEKALPISWDAPKHGS